MQKLKEIAREYVGPVIFAGCIIYGLGFAISETLPDPKPAAEPAAACTCAGKTDCSIAVFQVDDNTRAYCALGPGRKSCCEVRPAP